MREFIETLVNISLMAGVFALAVLAIRLIFKRAPKGLIMLMWGLVAIRLLCPLTIDTDFGVMPSKVIEQKSEETQDVTNVTYVVMGTPAVTRIEPASEKIDPWMIAGSVWAGGAVIMLTAGAVSYIRLKRRVSARISIGDKVFICDDIDTPFVVGIFKPEIIIPSWLDGTSLEHVLKHERTHIKHRDNIWKPLGYILLSLNWFNPAIWFAFISFCKDMELYCDEAVIRDYSKERSAEYLETLLNLSVSRNPVAALAFGEVGIGYRIRSITRYKKPAVTLVIVCILTMTLVSACFLTNRNEKKEVTTDSDVSESQKATFTDMSEEDIKEALSDLNVFNDKTAQMVFEETFDGQSSQVNVDIDSVEKLDDGNVIVNISAEKTAGDVIVQYDGEVLVEKDFNVRELLDLRFSGTRNTNKSEIKNWHKYRVESEQPKIDVSDSDLDRLSQFVCSLVKDSGEMGMTDTAYFKTFQDEDTSPNSRLFMLYGKDGSEDRFVFGRFTYGDNGEDLTVLNTVSYSGSPVSEGIDIDFEDPYDPKNYDSLVVISDGDADHDKELIQEAEDTYKKFDRIYVVPR